MLMPRQKFDIAYLIANHHLAFTKMKPLSEMEVTHVVDLGHTAYVHMHSQQDSCNVRRKRNLHMIYSAVDPYRILHMCTSLHYWAWLSTTVNHVYASDSCSMDQDAHIKYYSLPHNGPIHNLLNMWVSIVEHIQRQTQHQIPAAWIGTASPHGSSHNPKPTLGLLHTLRRRLTSPHSMRSGG